MGKRSTKEIAEVVGMDLGDKYSHLCVLSVEDGTVEEESRVPTTPKAIERRFSDCPRMHIAIEVGTHSPWMSRLLKECGHKVTIANPRKVSLISQNRNKTDRIDALLLARLARADPELLSPINHRGEKAQIALAVLRSRSALVGARTALINHVRGSCKSFGSRIMKCSPECFATKAVDQIPKALKPALKLLLDTIGKMTTQIRNYDKRIELMTKKSFPDAERLRQVHGVGPITALSYVLVLEDPSRFEKSRSVGAYLGLAPAKSASSESDPQLRITKEGDTFLRRNLVNASQHIMGPFGEDSDLRRHGLKIAERGGKNAKKRAVVAVARKLSVLLHVLWRTGTDYDPLLNQKRLASRKAL
jgi:transposase